MGGPAAPWFGTGANIKLPPAGGTNPPTTTPSSANHQRSSRSFELVGPTNLPDGLAFDPAGNLYLTNLENNAVTRITAAGQFQVIAQDPQLKWPDSFAIASDGTVYVTTSQLHIPHAQRKDYT